VLRETFDHLLANVPGALAGQDPEFLHQLRVGARRLRAALRVFRGVLRRGDRRALQRELLRLAAVSGPARDWDVNMSRLPAPLRAEAERRQLAAHARLHRALANFSLGSPPRGRAGARTSLPAFAQHMLARLERRILRLAEGIDWARASQRHALRIRLRRLRYACEFLGGAFPRSDSEPVLRSLKQLQDLLGELNDLEVARRLLRELGARGARHAYATRERALVRALPVAWRRFRTAPRFFAGRVGRTSRR
jgi:CHAD domain-containing protein